MLAFLLLIIRRSVRNLALTLAVLTGLLVLVCLLVAAPLYTSALADVGLRATLADAPLDQRSVRVVLPVDRLNQTDHTRLSRAINDAASNAQWLTPKLLSAVRTKRLIVPGGDARRRIALVEADTALENVRVVQGRLPAATANNAPLEIVLGAIAAEQFDLDVGATIPLAERDEGESLVTALVVGIVEPADLQATFWQSGVLDLEPVVSATQREATTLVAPGTLWSRVVSLLPPTRTSGEYRWRLVFDTSVVNGTNASEAEGAVAAVLRNTAQALPGAEVRSDFGGIVTGYRDRLAIARAPILLLLTEMAGLALIYIAWTAAFQAESTASEQAVMGARGAGVRQLVAVSGGQAALLAVGAALVGIPLSLWLLRGTVQFGPVRALAQSQGLRLVRTPDAGAYALGASLIGLLTLAVPAIPAARRSIIALRQGTGRPLGTPLWQRTYLDLLLVVIALVAFVQLQQQGGLLQRLSTGFTIDPFLLLAPLLTLVAGALLFLRLYPLLLNLAHGLIKHLRGLPLALALTQLTRNRAASTRLVLLLSLSVALGLFAQTFGATLALNQQQRAGYQVGADGRATLVNTEPLLPGSLPAGVTASWTLRDTVRVTGGRGPGGTLLALDPTTFETVAYNPPERPLVPIKDALQVLGPEPAADGLALAGQPEQIELQLALNGAPFSPAVMLSDSVGRFHRLRLQAIEATPTTVGPTTQSYRATIDLPPAAYPLRITALALLPNRGSIWATREFSKPPITATLGVLTVDDIIIERWDDSHIWDIVSDTNLEPTQEAAGQADFTEGLAGTQPVVITQGRGMRALLLRPQAQIVEPIPVLVNEPFLDGNNLALGGTSLVNFRNRPVLVRIAGVISRFPSLGIDGAPFMVAHGPRLMRLLNTSYARPVTPNELWLDLPADSAVATQISSSRGIGGLVLAQTVLRSFGRDPLAVGIAGVFFLGFVTSIALAALGFAIATYLAGRRRSIEFAVLQAIGFGRRAVLATLAIEQAVLVFLALLAGTLLGVALSRLILPFMAVSDRGRSVVPPYTIIVPWGTLASTYVGLIILFSVVTALVLWLLLRRGIGNALRIGEE